MAVISDFTKNVFINCPFDDDYQELLSALIFVVVDCGFHPRIASEASDSGQARLDKIKKLIKESLYSIHDISRSAPMQDGDLPRFNMPFELGLDLGCREYGPDLYADKKCLILDSERYRYKKVLSDISGFDIKAHDNQPEKLIRSVRNWFRDNAAERPALGPKTIWERYQGFRVDLPQAKDVAGFSSHDALDFSDYLHFVTSWITRSPA